MRLLPATDAHFAWLLGEGPPPPDAPRLPPGGLAEREVIELLRRVATEIGGEASWLMLADDEAVGIVSIKARDAAGRWDIGYSVAPERERRGYATAAVAALKVLARARRARGLTAETLTGGGVSARLLQRNGFVCVGQFDHPEDGWVDQWMVDW